MPSFTVHTPSSRPSDDPAVFVGDGWSWPAFIFGPFWLAWHRLWLAVVGYILLWVALALAGRFLGLHPVAASLLSTLINIGLALEGGQLRRWTLSRKGAPAIAVVSAPDAAEAEVRFITAQQEALPGQSVPMQTLPPPPQQAASVAVTLPSTPPSPARPLRQPEVIGSFPQPGGR